MKKQLFFIIFSITHLCCPNILLQPPVYLADTQLQQILDGWQTRFHWKLAQGYAGLLCTYEKQEASIILHAGYIPIRSYNFAYLTTLQKFFSPAQKVSPNYYFDQPLVTTDFHPQKIDIFGLYKLIVNKKSIFYTGAGISAANKIATMTELEKSLHMQSGLLDFLTTLMLRPHILCTAFQKFCQSCMNAKPTPAHIALHTIAQKKSCAIITENVDLLHQKAHDIPLHTSNPNLHTITPQDVQEVEIVVCVGLSHDDRGLLQYFKRHNPSVIFIAIDTGIPNYLSKSDYIVQQDLQIVIPELSELLDKQRSDNI